MIIKYLDGIICNMSFGIRENIIWPNEEGTFMKILSLYLSDAHLRDTTDLRRINIFGEQQRKDFQIMQAKNQILKNI